jgi:hypothetical protein
MVFSSNGYSGHIANGDHSSQILRNFERYLNSSRGWSAATAQVLKR